MGYAPHKFSLLRPRTPGPARARGAEPEQTHVKLTSMSCSGRLDPRRLIVVFMESLNCAGRQSCAMVAVASEAVTTAVAR